jgi:hypothetical protein
MSFDSVLFLSVTQQPPSGPGPATAPSGPGPATAPSGPGPATAPSGPGTAPAPSGPGTAPAPSGPGPLQYRGFTYTFRHTTLGSTPLDK